MRLSHYLNTTTLILRRKWRCVYTLSFRDSSINAHVLYVFWKDIISEKLSEFLFLVHRAGLTVKMWKPLSVTTNLDYGNPIILFLFLIITEITNKFS
jgi:hypothetical protein